MKLRDRPIKEKILLMMVSTSLLVLTLASIAWMIYDYSSLRKSSEDNLRVTAGIMGSNVSAALNFKMQDDASSTLSALREKSQVTEAAIFDSAGNLFVSYSRDNHDPSLTNILPVDEEQIHFASDGISLTKPIVFEDESVGSIYIKSDLSDLENRILFGLKLGVLIFAAAIVLSVFISLKLQSFVTTPIKELVSTMGRVSSEENFGLMAEKIADDEIGTLVDGFNVMLEQLQERDVELAQHREHLEDEVDRRTQELKTTNIAFQESERKMRAIVDTAADGIITFDSNGSILSFNKSACEVFGYTAEEIIGTKLENLTACHRTSNPGLMLTEHLIARARKAPIIGREFEGLSKDGRRFPMELSVTHVVLENEEQFTAILRDITARKAAETQLIRAKEEAENLARTKSQFLANMSHEIRTPMNGIFGTLQLVLKSQLNPEQREFLEMMKGCADSLIRIVDDVLDFSKVDAGKMQLENVNFQLRATLQKSLRLLDVKAKEANITFEVTIDDDVPDGVIGDPHRLGQILLNLISNAIKFTNDGGSVLVKTSLRSANSDALLLHFMVKDSGIGIPEEKQKVIFDSFTQEYTSSTRKYGGTGLGLAIVSNIVRLMGGDIWVKSKVNEGSEFHFTAVFHKQLAGSQAVSFTEEPKTIQQHVLGTGAVQVLLVEDHPINQVVQRRFLEDFGLTVTLAENGQEAVEMSAERPFSLILMDCQMPVMDGFEATAAIRAREEELGTKTPIIAMTAHALTGDRERCLEAGMDEYISKPINEDEFRDIIERMLGVNPNQSNEKGA